MVKTIFPLVRLDYKECMKIAGAFYAQGITIRFQDLITEKCKPNKLFYEIKKAEGIHNYYNYPGFVLLSQIMQDSLLEICPLETYIEIIQGIVPDAYTSPDGPTYEKERSDSLKEIKRISKEAAILIKAIPKIQIIGLVKGCDFEQIKFHLSILKTFGINKFIFHVGDFSRYGDSNSINRAKHFSSIIKDSGGFLFLYGMGAPKRFLEFSFADVYITYSHIIASKNGMYFTPMGKQKYSGKKFNEVSLHNLKYLFLKVDNLKKQTKLFEGGKCLWVSDTE